MKYSAVINSDICAWVYKFLLPSGGSEIPKTKAPNSCNKCENQAPLNPVCPVTSTFLPFREEFLKSTAVP